MVPDSIISIRDPSRSGDTGQSVSFKLRCFRNPKTVLVSLKEDFTIKIQNKIGNQIPAQSLGVVTFMRKLIKIIFSTGFV
jgi:hypothetical protein